MNKNEPEQRVPIEKFSTKFSRHVFPVFELSRLRAITSDFRITPEKPAKTQKARKKIIDQITDMRLHSVKLFGGIK